MVARLCGGLAFALAVLSTIGWPSRAAATCVGDCNFDGHVTVDELLTGVSIILGAQPASACPALDATANQHVTVDELLAAVNAVSDGCVLVATPTLVSSFPPAGATGVLATEWIRLTFAGNVDPAALPDYALTCNGLRYPVATRTLTADTVLVNPGGELPAGSDCVLTWQGPNGANTLTFATAAAGAPFSTVYDRTDGRGTSPFPDDFWLTPDASTSTGSRVNVPIPGAPSDVRSIFRVLLQETNKLDGFSPIGHLVVEFSDAPDPASLPRTPAESLDPLATIGLFDITPGSQEFGHRIPVRPQLRTDSNTNGVVSHTVLIFPSIPLTPGGHYGLVVTRRVFVDATRPLAPSPFFAAVLGPPVAGEADAVTRARALADEVLDVVASSDAPIPREDVALAVRISVRTTDDIPRDLLAVKQQVLDAPPPAYTIDHVDPDSGSDSDVAALVYGTWQAPDWRDATGYLKRDAGGLPVHTKTNSVPFVLALPKAARDGPVPVTMYQHGNPGSAESEVPSQARRTLAGAGFAVIGFTDNLNREVSKGLTDEVQAITAQVNAVFFPLLQHRKIPDYWVETNAEQQAFVRLIQGLGTLDVLPIDAPDGVPDLDVEAPLTYVGISEGANHAPGLLPYAPEIRAAALVAGGARLSEVLIHQQAQTFLDQLGPTFPNLTAADIWVALALFQTIYDVQDPHNHARFIYREPLLVDGTQRKASILLIEGLDDSMVPNNATDSLAWAMGPIPHLRPVRRLVPFLETVDGPLTANIDAHTTAAFFQYVPVGVAGIDPTPGCVVLPPTSAHEGHFCAQSAAESLHQRVVFFQTAVSDPVPTIINPFAQ